MPIILGLRFQGEIFMEGEGTDKMMKYKYYYKTPDGFSDIWMNSDGEFLTGLWFEGSRDAAKHCIECTEKLLPVFEDTMKWLDLYFEGKNPDFVPKYKIENLTNFRKEVMKHMLSIPYGETTTYGDIAGSIAKERGIEKMSSRAVGGAVGWNPICIIVPCHRVIGSNRSLTGYGGGIQNKIALLKLEGADI